MNKKFLIGISALLLCFGLSACTQNNNPSTNPSISSPSPSPSATKSQYVPTQNSKEIAVQIKTKGIQGKIFIMNPFDGNQEIAFDNKNSSGNTIRFIATLEPGGLVDVKIQPSVADKSNNSESSCLIVDPPKGTNSEDPASMDSAFTSGKVLAKSSGSGTQTIDCKYNYSG